MTCGGYRVNGAPRLVTVKDVFVQDDQILIEYYNSVPVRGDFAIITAVRSACFYGVGYHGIQNLIFVVYNDDLHEAFAIKMDDDLTTIAIHRTKLSKLGAKEMICRIVSLV